MVGRGEESVGEQQQEEVEKAAKKKQQRARLDSSFHFLDVDGRRPTIFCFSFFVSLFSLRFSLIMAGSRLPPLPRGGGGSSAALTARDRENNDAPALSQEQPFSQAMLAAGDDAMGMGLGFSCSGFDASGAPVVGGGAGAMAASTTHVVADWDANVGGASRRRGKVREMFFSFFFRRLRFSLFSDPPLSSPFFFSGLQRPDPRPLLPHAARGRRRRHPCVPAASRSQAARHQLLCVPRRVPQQV